MHAETPKHPRIVLFSVPGPEAQNHFAQGAGPHFVSVRAKRGKSNQISRSVPPAQAYSQTLNFALRLGCISSPFGGGMVMNFACKYRSRNFFEKTLGDPTGCG